MAQDFFRVEKGLAIETDNSEILYLGGPGQPAGDVDSQNAPVGSVWTDSNTGAIYVKHTVGTTINEWDKIATEDFVTTVAGSTISWREPVRVLDPTNGPLPTGTAGSTITIDGVVIGDGDRVLFTETTDANGKNVYIYDQASGTFVEDINDETPGDTVFVNEGTEAGKRFTYNTAGQWVNTDIASQDELNFVRQFIGKNAAGLESPVYTSTTTVTQNADLETAIGELDAELQAIRDFVGKNASGAETPNYTSTAVVTQGSTLEDAISALDLATTVASNEDSLQNAFMGKTAGNDLPNYSSTNVVTQSGSLEQAVGELDAERGADVTAVTGMIDPANTINQNIQGVANYVEQNGKTVTIAGVTTVQTIDSVQANFAEWDVYITDGAGKTFATKIMAVHDGTNVDFNNAGRLRIGGRITGLSVDVTLSGGNTLNLTVVSGSTVTVTTKRIATI